jgi:hypothetical protein
MIVRSLVPRYSDFYPQIYADCADLSEGYGWREGESEYWGIDYWHPDPSTH